MRGRAGLGRLCIVLTTLALGCSGGPETVAVTATDTACELDGGEIPRGTFEIEVQNRGHEVTEVYLYGPEDRVLGEVEHVQPGDRGSFTVDVGGGDYEVACKPGERGDGIRAALHVTGALAPGGSGTGTTDPATYRGVPSFGVKVEVSDDGFAVQQDLVIVAGQTVTFQLLNGGTKPHGFEVIAPGGTAVGQIAPAGPGASGEAVIAFTEVGAYRYVDPADADLGGTFLVIP